jgi:hypothetical protein
MSKAPYLAVVFEDDLIPSVIVEGWPRDSPLPRIVMVNYDIETPHGEHVVAFTVGSDHHEAYCERLELIAYEKQHDVLSPKAILNTLRRAHQ